MRIRYWIILFLLFFIKTLFAQQSPDLVQYTTEQGLSNNNVRALLQDSQGFIWLGTNDGLNRFNAYSFEVFSYDPTTSNGLSDNGILALYEDRKGNIWIGTNNGGLNRFNPTTNQFDSWQKKENDQNSLSDNTIYCINEDQEGNIWVGTKRGGLNKFDPKTERFTSWKADREKEGGMPSNYIWSIALDEKANILWLGTGGGLVKFELSTQAISSYPNNDGGVANLLLNEDQTIWVATWGKGLHLFDIKQERYIESYRVNKNDPMALQHESATGIVKAKGRNLWVSTYGGGLHYFDYQRKTFQNYPLATESNSIAPNSQWKIIGDHAGNLWIGTLKGAIHATIDQDKGFALFTKKTTDDQLSTNSVWSVQGKSLADLWIGTIGGLNHVSLSDDLTTASIQSYFAPTLSNNRIKALSYDREGNLWLGTWGGGISKLVLTEQGEPEVTTFKSSEDIQKSLLSNLILSIHADSKNRIWAGTLSGLSVYEPTEDRFYNYMSSAKDSTAISDNYVYTITETRDGSIWAGTARGLNLFLPATKSFKSYQADPKNPTSLNHNKVNVIFEDSRGILWVGTDGGGLNKMNREDGSFSAITEKDGLQGNAIKGISEDAKGYLWVSTNKGLNRIDVENLSFKHYDESDGLQASDFASGANIHLASGHIVVGGAKGFNVFSPDNLRENEFIPPVALTSFKLFGKEVSVKSNVHPESPLQQSILQTKELNLSYADRVIELDFTCLNYIKAHKNEFAYQLEGFDDDWRYTSSERRFATYTNLPPKDGYVFRVKAANNDGRWNEEGVSLVINVSPPIWKTWWFRIGVVLLILIAAGSFYQLRINRIKAQKDKLEWLVEARTNEVKLKNSELEQRNVELHQQQEEILAQRDYIEQKNQELSAQKNSLEKSYKNIQILSEVGHQITAKLELGDIVKNVYTNVNQLMDAAGFGIGIYNSEEDEIMFKGYVEKGEVLPTHRTDFDPKNDLASWCIHAKREIVINDIQKEYKHYIDDLNAEEMEGEIPQSLIYLPLIHLQKRIGVITVQSFQTNAYADREIDLLRNMANYVAIAVENAESYYEVKKAHDVIKTKNQDIMDSLRYAETIQKSVLPISTKINQHLAEHFVIFRPKDVVSGDFYWFAKVENRVFAAVVDCTGHGVPGAFMSLIGNDMLDTIINREGVFDPAKILELMHAGIRSVLQQDEQLNSDGMDVCLTMLEYQRGSNDVKLTFAGAKRPLFLRSEVTGFQEIKGDRKSVGGWQKERFVTFTNHYLDLQKGDCLYLTSDGFVDQHSLTNKKYGTKKLRKVLHNISSLDLGMQEECLVNELNTHQSTQSQRDDITLFALKL